ncbi:hypothetical protein [Geodermatophilus sp. URMC 60]
MEPDPREPTGDLGYDMAHDDMAPEVSGGRPRSRGEAPQRAPADDGRDDATGDYAYDEAHDFRR